MAQQNLSLFFRVEDGVIGHNNRDFTAENVDPSRTHLNIIYAQEKIEDKYRELFSDALKKYNDKQSRADRMIDDYLEHIKNSKQEKPFYELIVQIGKREECGVGTENYEAAIEMLDTYMKEFAERNPNMVVFNATMHLDESTPHLHIDFIPVCHNSKRGLETRTSLKQGLAEQGVYAQSIKFTERAIWAQREKERLTEILREHNLGRKIVGANYSHKSVKEFKAYQNQLDQINEQINELTQKPTKEISASEAGLLKNKTALLHRQLELKDAQISELMKKDEQGKDEFTEVGIFSKDKLIFIIDELRKRGVSLIEESNSIYVPKSVLPLVNNLALKYRPQKFAPTIRERVKLDLDRLIYKADSFDGLMEEMKKRGYEIKRGKYTSIKAPFAERAVRLEGLGEDYSRERLEKRIAEKMDTFENTIEQSQTAYEIFQPFYSAEISVMCEVAEYHIYPAKKIKALPYSFVNDENIEYLARQIRTLDELKIHSASELYERAEQLEEKIEMYGRVSPMTEQRQELSRLSELIKVYETVVKGNFIDNLIKAENERKAAEQRAAEQRKAAAERRQQAQQGTSSEHKTEQKPTQNNVKKSTKHRR